MATRTFTRNDIVELTDSYKRRGYEYARFSEQLRSGKCVVSAWHVYSRRYDTLLVDARYLMPTFGLVALPAATGGDV